MRNTFGALALVVAVLLGGGCKKASPLIGKWTYQQGAATVIWEFKPDGNATMSTKNGPIEVASQETYKLEGEKLTLTVKSVDVKGGQPAQADALKRFSQSVVGKERIDTVTFTSDDQITIAGDKMGAVALTRVKE